MKSEKSSLYSDAALPVSADTRNIDTNSISPAIAVSITAKNAASLYVILNAILAYIKSISVNITRFINILF